MPDLTYFTDMHALLPTSYQVPAICNNHTRSTGLRQGSPRLTLMMISTGILYDLIFPPRGQAFCLAIWWPLTFTWALGKMGDTLDDGTAADNLLHVAKELFFFLPLLGHLSF